MLTENERKEILAGHPTGIKGVFQHYGNRKKIFGWIFWLSIVIAILSSGALLYEGYTKTLEIFGKIIDAALQFLPVLLGFNLSGYAIIVGFGNTELIKSMTDNIADDGEKSRTTFQTINSVFAFALLWQITTTFISFVFFLVKELNKGFTLQPFPINFYFTIDLFGFFLLIFLVTYSLCLVGKMILNVFTFGQTHHFHLKLKKILEEKKKNTPSAPK